MEIKSYKKPGYISWSNSKAHSQLLCCQRFQLAENDLHAIDFLSLDIADRSKDLEHIGSCFFPRPFRCVAWDTFGEKQNTYSHGLLFGGMEDGSFTIWSPTEAIQNKHQYSSSTVNAQNYETQPSLLYEEEPEDNAFPIMCAQWNSLKPNYLSFGSNEVLIMDIAEDISNPSLLKPGNKNPHEGSYITSVKWNKEVPHIFASASSNGLIALWDIKSKSSIFQFKDSPNTANTVGRNVVICWSKNISTQIAVTLDDEKKNELQIWDLRNQKGPVVVIDQGHSKGINAMDWCETDPELILTGGHDSQALCWNYTQPQAEPISRVQSQQDILEVKWSKKLPSIFSVSTAESVSVYTLNQTNLFSYVPKWYKIPNGTSIFSNDTMLTYSEARGNTLHQYKLNTPKKAELVSSLDRLQSTVKGQDIQREDNDFWNLINAKKSANSQDQIFNFLNLDKQKIIKQVEKYTGKKRQNANSNKNSKQSSKKNKHSAFIPVSGSDAFSFFQNIKNQSQPTNKPAQDDEQQQQVQYEMVPKNYNWDIGKQRIIKQNILIGNYGGAIDAALKCGRTAQALIIAYSVGQQSFNTTLKTFFTQTTDSFITDTLKPLANRDTQELVRKYDIDKWKQCIALVFTITTDKRSTLLKILANRIREEKKNENAVAVCLILAEDFDQIAQISYQQLNSKRNHSLQRKKTAIKVAEKLIAIFESLTIQVELNNQFRKIIRESAYVCIQQGRQQLAYDLMIKYSPNCKDAFMDYLTSLVGLQNTDFAKIIQLPYMKRPEKPKVQAIQNTKNAQAYSQSPFNSAQQGGKPKPPKPIFNQRGRDPPVQDNGQSNNPPPAPKPPARLQQFQQSQAPTAFSPYEPQQEQQVHVKKTEKKAPPPPSGIKKNPPPPPTKENKHSDQQQSFTQDVPNKAVSGNPQPIPHSINKPQPPPKRSAPPPPKVAVQHQQKQQEVHYQQKVEQTPKQVMPPPKPSKKIAPPQPPVRNQSQQNDVRSTAYQQPQQQQQQQQNFGNWGNNQPQQNFNQIQSPKSNYSNQQPDFVSEQPKPVKKPPPPPSGKKPVPPPPGKR